MTLARQYLCTLIYQDSMQSPLLPTPSYILSLPSGLFRFCLRNCSRMPFPFQMVLVWWLSLFCVLLGIEPRVSHVLCKCSPGCPPSPSLHSEGNLQCQGLERRWSSFSSWEMSPRWRGFQHLLRVSWWPPCYLFENCVNFLSGCF